MKLFLVRHGESKWNKSGLIQGWQNPGLTETGINDAKTTAENLADKDIDIILSSDLLRARQTAEIIADKLDKEILFDWLIRERYHAKLEGTSNDINWSLYNDPNSKESIESGVESLEHLKMRADNFVKNLQLLPVEVNNIVVVAHGGISNAIQSAINPEHEFSRLKNGEIVEIEIARETNDDK